MSKTPEQIIQEAALAALDLIPEAEREVSADHLKLSNSQSRLNQLRNLAAMAKVQKQAHGDVRQLIPIITTSTGEAMALTKPNANALVGDKIMFVLRSTGRPLSTREISAGMTMNFGSVVPMSSIYAALSKGHEMKKFSVDLGKWSIGKGEASGA